MILNFIFSHLNTIALAVWLIFFSVVAVRFFRPLWLKNISFTKLALVAVGLRVFYNLFVTWGQYHVWSITDATGTYIKLPYFLHYAWTNFWMNTVVLFVISGLLYAFLKLWANYRGGLIEQGAELLLALMLVSGYPGILIMVPIGFALSVLWLVLAHVRGNKIAEIEPSFIWATLVSLLFTRAILSYVLLFINAYK